MTGPVRDGPAMIAAMAPVVQPGRFVFCTGAPPELIGQARGAFHEAEGLSLILPESVARAHGLPCDLPMAQITLTVHSALDGVGLTAAVAVALAGAGVPCNMVAAYHHDHAFVPADLAETALAALKNAQARVAGAGESRNPLTKA